MAKFLVYTDVYTKEAAYISLDDVAGIRPSGVVNQSVIDSRCDPEFEILAKGTPTSIITGKVVEV